MRTLSAAVCAVLITVGVSGCASKSACENAADLLACTMPGEPGPATKASSSPIPLSTSSWKLGDDAMMMGIRGRIALSEDGCVYLEGRGGVKNDVIWTAGYSADISAEGVFTLRNPAGEPVGHEGTKVFVAGGGFSGDEGGVPDGLLRRLVCEVADDSVLYINDELPPL